VAGASGATRTRARDGRMRSSSNQEASAGWCRSRGRRVVGLIAEEAATSTPSREFTRVDLPAPVDPPTTARSGASRRS